VPCPQDHTSALSSLVFCDFLEPGADVPKYQEATDQTKLLAVLESCLADYNAQSRSPMELVLFAYAAEHICRISRIIRQPYGNAMLVGVGGSGRQSLTRLAAFMANYKLFSIEISKGYGVPEWREDLKKVLLQAGGQGQASVLLLSDAQIKEEAFLEDVNNILNTGGLMAAGD
jgi:dynein heavy chain